MEALTTLPNAELTSPELNREGGLTLSWEEKFFVQLVFRMERSSPYQLETRSDVEFHWIAGPASLLKVARQYKKQFGMFASIKDSVRVASSRRTLYCVTDGEKLLHTGWISTRCRHYWIDNDAFVIGPIWTSKEARGRKIAQYALKRAVNSVLQESGNGVFFIDTSLDNIPCLKVIDRCGFGRPFGAFVRGVHAHR